MATTSNRSVSVSVSVSVSLPELLCAEPSGGHIFRHLLNGGSWFEADQMHWRVVRDQSLTEVSTLLTKKPTVANVERAKQLLSNLQEASKQLVCDAPTVAVTKKVEGLIATWSKPKAKAKNTNAFTALLEDSDEE
jgi:hypothetical protein